MLLLNYLRITTPSKLLDPTKSDHIAGYDDALASDQPKALVDGLDLVGVCRASYSYLPVVVKLNVLT